MNEVQFFQTKMGRQFFEVTMPELVRQIHRLNDMLALVVEMQEKKSSGHTNGKLDGKED